MIACDADTEFIEFLGTRTKYVWRLFNCLHLSYNLNPSTDVFL